MPTSPEAIAADIAEAATAGFRGRLIARGQARAIIWRDGELPPDAPAFAPQLSYDLHSYGYALLGLGLRLRELGGDAAQARTAFEQAATALEAVIAKGTEKIRTSTGLELQIMMPVVNAPFRFYWAYNPTIVQEFLSRPIVTDRSYFPNQATFARAVALYGTPSPFYEKRSTFRFTISRTF